MSKINAYASTSPGAALEPFEFDPGPLGDEQVEITVDYCGGGITVFNPIVQCGVQPTDRVGVVGVGGLGHLAIQFLNKWGCFYFV